MTVRILIATFLALLLPDQPDSHPRADITVHQPLRFIDVSKVTVEGSQNELGKDIEAIFAFVRDEIRHDVYTGVLRGKRGTLVALAGNSLDKSLLLAGLLRQAGYQTRFAQGRLEDSGAQRLLKRAFVLPKAAEGGRPRIAGHPGFSRRSLAIQLRRENGCGRPSRKAE